MSRVQFVCQNCSFRKEFLRSEIPEAAKQCKCPRCDKLFDLSEVIRLPGTGNSTQESSRNQTARVVEESIDDQQNPIKGKDESIERQQRLFEDSLKAMNSNNDLGALIALEEAEKLHSTPKVRSYLAYCRAKVKNEFSSAVRDCAEALKEDPRNADIYLNLARIYLLLNKRGPALDALRKGLKLGPHPQLMQEIRRFDKRRPQVIASLHRDHFLNRILGKLLSRLGLR